MIGKIAIGSASFLVMAILQPPPVSRSVAALPEFIFQMVMLFGAVFAIFGIVLAIVEERLGRRFSSFTVFARALLALGFTPSGLTKALGNRFTILSAETPIGYFF
jgi:archaellum biogenesis protein FlaJ (TadC family)